MPDVLREIGMIARALDAISNVEFKPYQLTKGQYLYLVRITEHPGIIQEDLGKLIMVERSTVIRAVQKLVDQGLVEKRLDATNRKIRHLFATPQAQPVYARVIAENTYSTQVALQGLTPAEQAQLGQLLQRARQNVATDWEAVQRGQTRHY
ncbi:MarR family winged helix-turn-helix transcriptional regulator [Levilactobacillus acidifarinae]|uniref:Transcriptional regulator, MarR family protein n=1 Tax=Levilactobacillus acidifarinae DSM 19394 = JCM 15949 TaxID=1423715 RepID=A0A0R1LGZ5_9LACO|nr:MarR family transcriptional regulator [Levilactobacillus acidifarinae]KRK94744.1 transcriptional regulator, MarR family protein [Levilactobacillus acidifarinae DSM 19394]GEO68502.1 MarR family transcriptional regulator [Levilactobacillus acidifarinae]